MIPIQTPVSSAKNLAKLARNNRVEIHFVPSHITPPIPCSDVIDALAKTATTEGVLTQHDPVISSYRLHLRNYARKQMRRYLVTNIKPSQFSGYPERSPFRCGKIVLQTRPTLIELRVKHNNPLLNRARTGHTRCKSHLKNIGIESDEACRFCSAERETLEHLLIQCPKLQQKLGKHRTQYNQARKLNFNDALWKHSNIMAKLLRKAAKNGCQI